MSCEGKQPIIEFKQLNKIAIQSQVNKCADCFVCVEN